MSSSEPDSLSQATLLDRWGRVHSNLRISVTDRCNIRCSYCMPAQLVRFKPRSEILTFEEIDRFVRAVVPLGIQRLRITGGEPLVRSQVHELVARLAAIEGVRDLALTTNGMLLDRQATALRQAGLQRLNISLDTLSEENFVRITRRPGLQRVLDGIAAARQAGFTQIRLNAVALRDLTEAEILPLAHFARSHNLVLRFIEFMPLDAASQWQAEHVLSGTEIRQRLESEFGGLVSCADPDPSQPASDYRYADGGGTVGFISSVTQPFCQHCNRLRLTAEGKLRNCLFSTEEWDVRSLLRGDATPEQLRQRVRECVWHKKPAHGIETPDFERPARAMYQIGG